MYNIYNASDGSLKIFSSSIFFFVRDYLVGRHSAHRKHKRLTNFGSGVVITSKQSKECSTGMFLKTDFNYLHSENYSAYSITNKKPMSTKILGN